MRWPFNRGDHMGRFDCILVSSTPTLLCMFQARTWISNIICYGFFIFNFQDETFFFDFVDIGGILDHHCLHFLFSMFFSVLFCVLCVLCCMTVVDRGLNMWLIINVFCFSTNPNVLHEVTFGTHMEYPDGSLPSKFNINITNVLMYYMKWPLEHTWSTQTDLFQVSLT